MMNSIKMELTKMIRKPDINAFERRLMELKEKYNLVEEFIEK